MGKEQKEKRKEKKKREGETLFQAVKMNLHISFFFFFGRTFTQKFEGLKEEKLITKEKFLKFV